MICARFPRQLLALVFTLTLLVTSQGTARAEDAVRVGYSQTQSDAALFIADKNGYFKDEGLAVTFTPFSSSAGMIAPLGSGQLDVGGGAAGAGLFNSFGRGLDIRIVADKGSVPPGYGWFPFLVRTDLVKSGRYKTLKDIKGMTIAVGAKGSASWSTLNQLVLKAGLQFSDIKPIALSYPDTVAALRNGSVDAALVVEPSATVAEKSGVAVKMLGNDTFYPNQQLAVILYGSSLLKARHDVGVRFMRAYIRASRFYDDALKDGKIAGPNADAVIKILTESTPIKDPQVYREIVPNGLSPDGRVNAAALRTDLAFFEQQGMINGNVKVEDVIDDSFANEAVKALGPYKPLRK